MKKIIVLALLILFLCGCSHKGFERETTIEGISYKDFERETTDEGTYGVTIFRYGHHQYIFVKHFNAGGLCHYEDCDYCKAMNQGI